MEALLYIPLLLLIGSAMIFADFLWSKRRLREWARENGVRIISEEYRLLLRGPFNCLGKYSVYYITSRDDQGAERKGWVRLGSFFSGLLSHESEVLWEWSRDGNESP